MTGIMGVNILAQFVNDRAGLINWLSALQPSALIVMDDLNFASQLKQQFPSCIVIHRSWHPEDSEFPIKWSPQQFVDAYCRNVPPGIVTQCCNEPSGYGDLVAQSKWFANVMDLSPVPLALPQWGVGHPKEDFGTDLDILIRAFGRHRDHLFCTHEYFQFDPVTEPYHTGRFKAIVTRFQQLGIPVPRIVISEAGRDVGGGLYDGWKAIFDEPTYATRLKQQAELYRNTPVVGMCVFCMGKGGGDRWITFDIEAAGIVKQSLVDYNRSLPVTLLPKPDLTPLHEVIVIAAPATGSNVRDSADTSGGIVKQLFVGNVIQISERSFNNDTYNWYQLGTNQYIADTDAFDWSPKTTPIPPSDDLDQAKALLHDALGQLEILQDNVAELAVVIGNLKARLDAL